MSRMDDVSLFLDMYWHGGADMYAEPVRRANAGDPFWWAALTVISEDGRVICSRPVVQYVDWDGDPRDLCGKKFFPLFHEWGFIARGDTPISIGTLLVPSENADLGYVTGYVEYPEDWRLYHSMLTMMLGLDEMAMRTFAADGTSSEPTGDAVESLKAILETELERMGGR